MARVADISTAVTTTVCWICFVSGIVSAQFVCKTTHIPGSTVLGVSGSCSNHGQYNTCLNNCATASQLANYQTTAAMADYQTTAAAANARADILKTSSEEVNSNLYTFVVTCIIYGSAGIPSAMLG